MFCTNCGAKLEEGANFCITCGASVKMAVMEPNAPTAVTPAEPYVPPAVSPSIIIISPVAVAIPAVVYAGFWRRFAAVFIDGIILSAGNSTLRLALGLPLVELPGRANQTTVAMESIIYLLSILVDWLYYSLMECSSNQATVGKMAMGIIVTDMEGKRVSFGKATLRYYNKIISALILGIGFLMAAFTAKKQALHDIMAGTLVVMKR